MKLYSACLWSSALLITILLLGSCSCQSPSQPTNPQITWIQLITVTDLSTRNWNWDGYVWAVNFTNSKNNGNGVYLGNNRYVKFNLTGVNDSANFTWGQQELQRRINSRQYHAILGTATTRAFWETQMGNASGILTILCCVGPNLVYEPDRRWVFGIHGNSAGYSENFIKNARLRGAKRIGIAYGLGAAFPETLGAASINHAVGSGYEMKTFIYPARPKIADYKDDFDKWADELIKFEIDLFVGATIVEDGNAWFDTWQRKRYPLKGLFLTVVPDNTFFAAKGASGQYIASGNQWDPTVRASDPFFGTTLDVAREFKAYHNYAINYHAASAAAAIYALIVSLNQTFYGKIDANTDIMSPDNYEQLRFIMSRLEIDSFFGPIAFDRLRRNRKETVTIQNIQIGNASVIFPIEQSAKEFVYPIPGTLYVKWSDPAGIFLGVITTICLVSCVVIGLILFLFRQVSRTSSPMFNITSILGAMIAASTLYLLPGIPNDDLCNAIPWMYIIGMTLLIAPILAKTFRIRIIINSMEKMKVVKVKDLELGIWIGSLLLINIFVLSLWMGISKLYQKNARCESDHTGAFIITFIVIGSIYIVVLCVLAFQVRKFVSDFSDAAILMFAGAYLSIVIVIFVPLVFYVDLDSQPDVHLLLVVAAVLFPTVGIVYILFIPVIYVVFFIRGNDPMASTTRGGNSSKISMSANVAKYANNTVASGATSASASGGV